MNESEVARRRARIALVELKEAERRGLPRRVLQLMRRTVDRELSIAEGAGEVDGVVERAVRYDE